MLKSFSAQTNPLGAINFKGTWNASTNTPALASSVGTNGDYYVVSVAGSTTLDGISNWGVGDWAVFNGSVWQRVEGGADVNAVNLTVSGNTTLSGPVSVTPTWNAGATVFTGIGFNVTDTASAAGSLLFDLQVGGSSQFKVAKNGIVTAPFLFSSQYMNASIAVQLTTDSATINLGTGSDLTLARDAANTLAQRRGTNAQTHRIYGTFTDASNYRRLTKTMSTAGVAEIKPEGAGTGASGNVLHISGLPTSNPGPGILWNNLGIVNVGT